MTQISKRLVGCGCRSSRGRCLISKLLLGFVLLLLIGVTIAFAQKPELVVQAGHSSEVHSVAFSPDGKTLASGSGDNTIKLWDVTSGTELRTLKHSDQITSVAFSPDGRTLASGSWDKTIKLWDVTSGRELHSLKGHSDKVSSVAFSADGKTLASGSGDNTIKLWDITSGTELRTLKGHSSAVLSVAFSADRKTLASGSSDNTIKLWDLSSGIESRTLKGHSDLVWLVAFSPDGKTVASASSDQTIKLWDVATGTELRTLKGHSNTVSSVAFSADGKTLVSGSWDETIKLWDVTSGTELGSLNGSNTVNSVAFSADGKTLASGSQNHSIKLWDVASRTELRLLKGRYDLVWSVAFSPDGKTLASGSSDNTIKLWEVTSGTGLRTLKGHSSTVSSVAFSPDGKTLASAGWDKTIKLWDVTSGTELRTLKGHSSPFVTSVAFSADGTTLASASWDKTIKLWDLKSGTELRTLKDSNFVNTVAFSADGKVLASGGWDTTITLWDVTSGTELRTLKGHSGLVYSVVFSPDGKTVASASWDHTIKLWDVTSGTELRTLKGHSDEVYSVAFSPDGKTLASGSWDNTIKLWDVTSGTELRTLKGHWDRIYSVAFSPDGKTLASGGWDADIKLWRVSDGTELASLVALDEKDWVVVTPDGLFDGSPAAWDKIVWRFNSNTFNHAPVEAFFGDFYYPGLLADIFAGKRPKAPADISQKDRRQPQLKLTQASPRPDAMQTARNVAVRIDVSQAPAGAQDVRLFRNGSLVKVWHGDVLKRQSRIALEATVPIVAGENRLTAYAFNHDNIKSSDATLTIVGADSLKRRGVAYILAAGVNEYANSQYNLKYAVADAQDFAEELKLQQANLNNYERVEVILLNDKDATKANILKSLSDLSAKVQPEDALVIFFAGHGTAQQNRFYLIPHDLGYAGSRTQLNSAGLQRILMRSISDEEISRAVEGIDAGQLLLVIDACNSGQALEAEEKRRGPMNSKGLAQLAYEKGMYILTAAQSYQAANEAERYGHGFLTYALVEEGLKTDRADRSPKDGQVLLREWLDYATERVPQMQQEKLEEQQKQGRQLDRIKFAEADSGNERSIQRPRVFYRRETETHPLVVAKP